MLKKQQKQTKKSTRGFESIDYALQMNEQYSNKIQDMCSIQLLNFGVTGIPILSFVLYMEAKKRRNVLKCFSNMVSLKALANCCQR